MELLEQTLTDFEMARKVILLKGKEVTANLGRLYDALDGSGFCFDFNSAGRSAFLKEEGGTLSILCGSDYRGSFYSIIMDKRLEHKVYIGTGDNDRNSRWHRDPSIPGKRVLPNQSKRLHKYKKKWYASGEDFFTQASGLHKPHPKRIQNIVMAVAGLPNVIGKELQKMNVGIIDLNRENMDDAFQKVKDNFLSEKEILLHLYRTRPNVFKVYFQNLSDKQQIGLCRDILHLSSNPLLDEWISKEFPKVVDEAGRDNYIG